MFNSDSLICLFMLLLVKERVIEFGVFGNAVKSFFSWIRITENQTSGT